MTVKMLEMRETVLEMRIFHWIPVSGLKSNHQVRKTITCTSIQINYQPSSVSCIRLFIGATYLLRYFKWLAFGLHIELKNAQPPWLKDTRKKLSSFFPLNSEKLPWPWRECVKTKISHGMKNVRFNASEIPCTICTTTYYFKAKTLPKIIQKMEIIVHSQKCFDFGCSSNEIDFLTMTFVSFFIQENLKMTDFAALFLLYVTVAVFQANSWWIHWIFHLKSTSITSQ